MRTVIAAALITGIVSITAFHPGPVLAQMEHSGMHAEDHMAAQHRLMATYAKAQAKINEALQKADAAVVETETRKLLATITELKKVMPHKNRAGQKAMRRIAAAFEADLKTTVASVGKRDFAGAREAFRKAEGKCLACHARFRD